MTIKVKRCSSWNRFSLGFRCTDRVAQTNRSIVSSSAFGSLTTAVQGFSRSGVVRSCLAVASFSVAGCSNCSGIAPGLSLWE